MEIDETAFELSIIMKKKKDKLSKDERIAIRNHLGKIANILISD